MESVTDLEVIQIEDRLHRLLGAAQAIYRLDEEAFAELVKDADGLCGKLKGGLWAPKALIYRMLQSINAFETEAGLYADSEASFKNAASTLRRLMTAMLTDKTLEELPTGPRIS